MQLNKENLHQRRRRNKVIFFNCLFWSVLIAASAYIYYNSNINRIAEKIQKKEELSVLVVLTEQGSPVATSVIVFNTETNSLGLLDIPSTAGNLLTSLKRSDRYSLVYQEQGSLAYEMAISELIAIDFNFSFSLEVSKFIEFIDLLGGLTIEVPFDIRIQQNQHYYWLDKGVQKLDGDKVVEYLRFPVILDAEKRAILEREQPRFLQILTALFIRCQNLPTDYQLDYARRLWAEIESNIDRRSFLSWFSYFARANYTQASFVYQKYLGNERSVKGQKITFPIYNGELLRERMKWVKRSLVNTSFSLQGLALEILNGTQKNRLASNTADIYNSYAYNVVQIGNTNSPQEKTLVISFVGEAETERIAGLINCENIEYRQPSEGQEIFVKIILGEDFNGRYVIR